MTDKHKWRPTGPQWAIDPDKRHAFIMSSFMPRLPSYVLPDRTCASALRHYRFGFVKQSLLFFCPSFPVLVCQVQIWECFLNRTHSQLDSPCTYACVADCCSSHLIWDASLGPDSLPRCHIAAGCDLVNEPLAMPAVPEDVDSPSAYIATLLSVSSCETFAVLFFALLGHRLT